MTALERELLRLYTDAEQTLATRLDPFDTRPAADVIRGRMPELRGVFDELLAHDTTVLDMLWRLCRATP